MNSEKSLKNIQYLEIKFWNKPWVENWVKKTIVEILKWITFYLWDRAKVILVGKCVPFVALIFSRRLKINATKFLFVKINNG